MGSYKSVGVPCIYIPSFKNFLQLCAFQRLNNFINFLGMGKITQQAQDIQHADSTSTLVAMLLDK